MNDLELLVGRCLDLYEAWLRGPVVGHGSDEVFFIVQLIRKLEPDECIKRYAKVYPFPKEVA